MSQKLVNELKCLVDECTRDDLIMLSRLEGKTTSEYLRIIVQRHLYGTAGMARVNHKKFTNDQARNMAEGGHDAEN